MGPGREGYRGRSHLQAETTGPDSGRAMLAPVVAWPGFDYWPGMAVLPILLHPDPRLRRKCQPVSAIDSTICKLADDMVETMYAAPGIGLAAPQVGRSVRLFVMDRTQEDDETPTVEVLINPELVRVSETLSTHEEGCLSIPEHFEEVTRPAEACVRYTALDGSVRECDFDGVQAICVQHEIDHLNGRLFIDYLSAIKRSIITRKMRKLKRSGKGPGSVKGSRDGSGERGNAGGRGRGGKALTERANDAGGKGRTRSKKSMAGRRGGARTGPD